MRLTVCELPNDTADFAHAWESLVEHVGDRKSDLVLLPEMPTSTAPKWLAGGQAAAVISGAFCLSSNLAGMTANGGDFAGVGWIIEPEEGKVLGTTSINQPLLTADVDLEDVDHAQSTYPRYVQE